MEMGEVKQTSKQEEMRKCYESRQVGGIEKVEEKSKKVPLKDRKKRIIKNETYEEKRLIGINRGQRNKNKKKQKKDSFHTRDSWSSNQLQIYTKYLKLFLKNVIIMNTMKPSAPTYINSATV